MDKSIPVGAAILLKRIALVETGKTAPDCYDVIFAHKQHLLDRPVTRLTLDQLEALQPSFTKRFGSSAAGAYQFMKNTLDAPNTLKDIEGEMGLTGKEIFSPDLQDRMGYHLLKRRGYLAFMAGKISRTEFGKRLAQEWASFPVLQTTKGHKRNVARGQSYYAGDGMNKALISAFQVEALLDEVKAAGNGPQVTEDAGEEIIPSNNQSSAWLAFWGLVGAVLVGLLAAIGAAFTWLASLPCAMFNLFC